MNDKTPTPKKWGFSDEELASMETVYRDGLMKDQVVLISGGGSGIGRAMAFLFARLGAHVVVCGRREEKLLDAAKSIKEKIGVDVTCYPMTIRDPEMVDGLMDMIFDKFGRLDLVVNNGGGQFPQDAIDFSRKGWLAVIDTNLNGTWWMMQTAAQRWIERKQAGNIINIVAHVERGMPQAAHTCAARAGVIYLSKSVSTEWAPYTIRVNCVAPGSISTEGFAQYPPEATERFHLTNPMKRPGDAWDVAEAVVYMAAPSGKFITGEVLTIDGGMQHWGVVWPAGMPDYFKVN
ncbi:SDR family oxidoreductase [Emcibacter sp.]|uniref:SDR family oxidoreductase n=1 Tax=Emcibacter sp. TaxID=1979954 RepID=UPI002AA79063|nr:SDR family oxidoreductase [Emcibacter sp.]